MTRRRKAPSTKAPHVLATPCGVCGRAIVLHFDARGRKLDCVNVLARDTALADARRKLDALHRYIARLEAYT